MKKAIILYKGGMLRYASEKKVRRIMAVKSEYQNIYSILIPMLDHKSDAFIPIVPDNRWLFHRAQFATFTAIYSFGYEVNDIEQMKVHRTSQETCSLFELVNIVHYLYKLRGYISMIIDSRSECETLLNLILPVGVMLKLYDACGKPTYEYSVGYEWSHDLMELMETGDIITFEKTLLVPFSEICSLFDYDEYSLWFNNRDCIRVDGDEWYGDHRIRAEYLYLNFLSKFHAFCLCRGSLLRTLIGAHCIGVTWFNLSDDADTPYKLSDPLPKLKQDLLANVHEGNFVGVDCSYEIYAMELSECDDFLYIIYFGRTMLEYSKYILYAGILDEKIDIEKTESMMIFEPSWSTTFPRIQGVLCRESPTEFTFCKIIDELLKIDFE